MLSVLFSEDKAKPFVRDTHRDAETQTQEAVFRQAQTQTRSTDRQ